MIRYLLKKSGIFYVTFEGTISVEDITSYLLEFEKLDYLPPNLLAIYDLRNAEMQLSANDISNFSELSSKVTSQYKSVRTAFVVNKPSLTAYSLLFSNSPNPDKTKRRVFIAETSATNWLLQL